MELKLLTSFKIEITTASFNCTFMELKYRILCAPNSLTVSFNCTFMELKSDNVASAALAQSALIVPLWN